MTGSGSSSKAGTVSISSRDDRKPHRSRYRSKARRTFAKRGSFLMQATIASALA